VFEIALLKVRELLMLRSEHGVGNVDENLPFTSVKAIDREYDPVRSITIHNSPGIVRICSTSVCSSVAI